MTNIAMDAIMPPTVRTQGTLCDLCFVKSISKMDKGNREKRKGEVEEFDPQDIIVERGFVIIHITLPRIKTHIQANPGKRQVGPVADFFDVHVEIKKGHQE
jgi:hypothetical protein